MITETQIRDRIKELESLMERNEEEFPTLVGIDPFIRRRILMQTFNIESQLDALYYVLGEKYDYKYN